EKTDDRKDIFYVITPFNSRMVFDYSTLIGKYEKIRKFLFLKLDNIYPNQILIEKFKDEVNPIESIKKWAKIDEKTIHGEIDELLFTGTGGSGATQRDKSIVTIQVKKKYTLPLGIIGMNLFKAPPLLIFESMSFHEYGIGMIYCKLEIEFTQDFIKIKEEEPKKIMANLLDKIVRFPDLLKESESIGKNVFRISKEIFDELDIGKPILNYNELFSNQQSDIPLWGHIVLIRDKKNEQEVLPIDEIMSKIIEVSHPEGRINFTKDTDGFVHIGWGNSLWAGLSDIEFNYAKEILRYLEIEWRTLQVFNEILYRRLNQLASYQGLQKRRVRKAVRWINKLRMEMELYSINKSNYLQNLAPFAHFIYQQSIESWRNSQMEAFFMEKLDVFEYLHNRGKERLQELSDNKMNNILFLFTCISLISTFIDGLMFVLSEHIAELWIFRLFLLIFPPIGFIVIIVLLIERIIGHQ
ncbi:MAG: hypothetical protein ACFFC3_15580, partial [Candidatus Odinarchaeota archaeon]